MAKKEPKEKTRTSHFQQGIAVPKKEKKGGHYRIS